MRLIALAAVAACGVYLSARPGMAPLLAAGILAGALLGLAQHLLARRGPHLADTFLVLAQVGVWTFLTQISGGQRSPLLVGYVLEVPLAGLLLGRRGCAVAALGSAAAYSSAVLLLRPPMDAVPAAAFGGFVAVSALLSCWVVGSVERQEGQVAAAKAVLQSRAESLAEQLRLLGDYLAGALLAIDDLGRVASINHAGAALLGAEPAALLGRPWQEVLRPDPEGARQVARALTDGGGRRELRMTTEGRDGRGSAVAAELWTVPTAEGARTFLLLDPLPRAGSEPDPLRRLGEAVACISHQVRNSLHAIEGYARALGEDVRAQGGSDAPQARLLAAVHTLGELARDTLAMAGGQCRPDEDLLLEDLVASALSLSRRPADRVQIAAAAGPVQVRGHRGQLVHAFFNLLDNACRVTPSGRAIKVNIGRDADGAHVEILDGGPGMPDALLNSDGPLPSREGAGYGLLAARRFLEANGGSLAFERLAGGGTRCRVSLPVAQETAQVVRAVPEATQAPAQEELLAAQPALLEASPTCASSP